MTHPSHPQGNAGYILISVLAIVALLSGLVAALLGLGRASVDTAYLAGRDLRREALIQSAVALAGYQLFVLRRPIEAVDGQQLRLDAGVITLRVTSDAGKADVNGSRATLLAAAYRAAGLTGLRPDVFASRLMDWRAPHDPASSASPPSSRSRHAPFRSLDDLSAIPGIPPEDIIRLRPFLTTFNASGRISASLTPESLLATVVGISGATAREIVKLRRNVTPESERAIANLIRGAAGDIDMEPPVSYQVAIRITTNEVSPVASVTAVLSAGANPAAPYHVLAWSEPTVPN